MRTVLPGKPRPKLQAVSTAQWEGKRLIVYISGNALVILGGPHNLIQTIYQEESQELDAVSIDEATGKIAIASPNEVRVYRPYGRLEGGLRWSLESSILDHQKAQGASTLSWGSNAELLVGASSLKLYQTDVDNNLIWNRSLSSSVTVAEFSNDGSLIASTGRYDRLIKLWRRQTFSAEDTRFDFTYLQHPTSVTGIHWRRSYIHQHHVDNVIFSICADNKIRIWAAADPHCAHALQLWGQIDMQDSIQPRLTEAPSKERFAFFIDSKDLIYATEKAVSNASGNTERENHALEHLREIAKNSPEICVVLDGCGNMSAWGLENIGTKTRKPTDIFNVAHVDNFKLPFLHDVRPEEKNVQFLTFSNQGSESPFVLLSHHFDGRILWSESKLDLLFDPSPDRERSHLTSLWTGHDGSIKKIVRSHSGKALISRTNENEGMIWKHRGSRDEPILSYTSSLKSSTHIHRTLLLHEGDFVVCLHHDKISLWNTTAYEAQRVSFCEFQLKGKPLCLVQLPSPSSRSETIFVATVTSEMECIVWLVDLPRREALDSVTENAVKISLTEYCKAKVDVDDGLAFVLPVDPAGSDPVASGFLDAFAKDIAISYSCGGTLHAWTAVVEESANAVKWLKTSAVKTGISNPTLASGNALRKTALVDASRNRLTIWDQSSGQLEHDATFDAFETIRDLDWSATPDNQSILAVGFPFKIVLLAQLRYDYLNAGPAWAPIREINIKEITSHPIGDSVWLGSGNLVVGAGNQLFVYDEDVNSSDDMVNNLSIPIHKNRQLNIFDLVTYLNGTLPLFHPQLLTQCILAGKQELVQQIILALHKSLKYFVSGDQLDSFLNIPAESLYINEKHYSAAAKTGPGFSYEELTNGDDEQSVTEELAASLNENLAKLELPQLSSRDQIHLAGIVECVATAEKHRRSMDDFAMRYLLIFRQHILRKGQSPAVRVNIGWREIVWAFHSGSQDILMDLVSKQFHGRMLWKHARESGMFMWITDISTLRSQFEVIARNEYTRTDEKNPIDCSLFYLALRKKTVLLGLWRMAAWNREQASTSKLLKNNFSEARWKTAALKNAYALLSKRRFEYAAAFFILADHLQDAVNVCAHQLEDLQLAITVARVYDGDDDNPVLQSLLQDNVLHQAALEGNHWLATWAFWMLGRRGMAVRALISPVSTLVKPSPPITMPNGSNSNAQSFLTSDPALVVLYNQLRQKSLQTLQGASSITPREEWEFVLQSSRIYSRMGCGLLALDLVRNWGFLEQPNDRPLPTIDRSRNGAAVTQRDARKMMNRRSSNLIIDDLSAKSPTSSRQDDQKAKRAPTMFEEPAASSLLDSFGF